MLRTFVQVWAADNGLTYSVLADPAGSLTRYYRPEDVGVLPFTVITDRDGVVLYNRAARPNIGEATTHVEAAVAAAAAAELSY